MRNDNDILITVHCSMTGFPPAENSGYGGFGSPDGWKKVLALYPGLRINLAHYGNNGDGWDGWPAGIIDLMKGPRNHVYTDLGSYTSEREPEDIPTMLADNDLLKGRLGFGTDYDVMLMTDFISPEKRFTQFRNVLLEEEMAAMSLNREREDMVVTTTRKKPAQTTKCGKKKAISDRKQSLDLMSG